MATTLKASDTVVMPAKEMVQEKSLFSCLISVFGFASSSKDSKSLKSTKELQTRSSSVTSKDGHHASSTVTRTRSFSTLSHESQSYDTRSQSSRSSHRSHTSRSQSSRSPRESEFRSQHSQSPRSQSSRSSPRSHRDETQSQSSSYSSRSNNRDRSQSSSRTHKSEQSKQRSNPTRSDHDLESFLMPMLEMKKANTIERRSKTSPREKQLQQYDSFLSRKSTGRTELTSVDEETEVTSFSTMSNTSGDSTSGDSTSGDSSPLTVSR